MNINSFAQAPAGEQLRKKAFDQLHDIVESSPALTGIVAVDLTSGETFEYNQNVVFPQASAIKVPILMEVYRQAHQGKFSLDDVIAVETKDVVGGTGIIKDLQGPLSFSIRNLCMLMITLSDNTATNVLIDLVGMPEINASLKALGLQHTLVQRKMIDAAASGRGEENISTPTEASSILQMLHRGKFLNKTTSKEIISILKKTDRRTSRLATGIPTDIPIAFKPGFLNGVSTEWAIVFLPERPYAVAIMESYKVEGHASQTMERVSEVLFQYFWRRGNSTRYGAYIAPGLLK